MPAKTWSDSLKIHIFTSKYQQEMKMRNKCISICLGQCLFLLVFSLTEINGLHPILSCYSVGMRSYSASWVTWPFSFVSLESQNPHGFYINYRFFGWGYRLSCFSRNINLDCFVMLVCFPFPCTQLSIHFLLADPATSTVRDGLFVLKRKFKVSKRPFCMQVPRNGQHLKSVRPGWLWTAKVTV